MHGTVQWIGTRPKRRAPLVSHRAIAATLAGLEYDHYQGSGKRTVTLVQQEHLPVIASLTGSKEIHPEQLRRNLVISGINLIGLKNRRFRIGSTLLEGSGICAPCSRMEETLGAGGYAAVRGHGGITARVIEAGNIGLGDSLVPV